MVPPSKDELARLEALERLVEAARESGHRGPLFAHLRVRSGGRESDLLLGQVTRLGEGPSILDWQKAPLTEVFFTTDEGEEYELDLPDRLIAGTLLEKHLFSLSSGRLRFVELAGKRFERDLAGWVERPSPFAQRIPLRKVRSPFRSPLEVTLDDAQRAVVDLPENRSVLLLGEAGFGKTTVALHRLAQLSERMGEHFRGLVILPTEGLRRLTALVLERRGVKNVDVWTYDRWAAKLARRTFPDLPPRETENQRASVVKLKRHEALLPALEQFVRDHPRPLEDEDHPQPRAKVKARRFDLHHLFGDRTRMAKVVADSQGALFPQVIEECAEQTRVQFLDSTESEYGGGHDAERLKTADGERIDAGTPTGDADSLDPEDYAVLFELERLRCARTKERPVELGMYDCVVVDEAQEFAPLELRLLGRAVAKGGTAIVAGDAAQQVDPTSHFTGWDGVMANVLHERGDPAAFERAVLKVNYRCPPEVTALARAVARLDGPPSAFGSAIGRARFDHALHLTRYLTDALAEVLRQDPAASLCVICRTPEAARTTQRLLGYGLSSHLALHGDFHFRPGAIVTSVSDVKGLEFDYVVLPDADERTYPDTGESRRALYVAVTRATHQLLLCAAGAFSPALP